MRRLKEAHCCKKKKKQTPATSQKEKLLLRTVYFGDMCVVDLFLAGLKWFSWKNMISHICASYESNPHSPQHSLTEFISVQLLIN